MKNYKSCLTIAGSDPSGGAGIQADLKVFTCLGCYGQAIPTALTVQNTVGVLRSMAVDADLVCDQLCAVLDDCPPDVVKIGILPNVAVVHAVVRALRRGSVCPVVYDPVMISSSGLRLMDDDVLDTVRTELAPYCTLVTPNLMEARAWLNGESTDSGISSPAELAHALSKRLDGTAVLVKGGHLEGEPVDTLYHDGKVYTYRAERVVTRNTHGTGCVLSSAIASYYAHGGNWDFAVKKAKDFLTRALRKGACYDLGKGHGPLYLLPDIPDS